VRRDQPLSGQIPPDRYGYIVLAHVLEHIADPIGYLVDLVGLLAPGGVLVIMLPDKRRTHDEPRPVTSLQHLLNDFHEKPTYPSVEHIMEYAPCVIDDLKGKDLGTVFHWARANHATGQADVHCHVWRDEDFFAQVDQLIAMGVLANVAAAGRWHNRGEFNEFMLALRARWRAIGGPGAGERGRRSVGRAGARSEPAQTARDLAQDARQAPRARLQDLVEHPAQLGLATRDDADRLTSGLEVRFRAPCPLGRGRGGVLRG